MHGSGDGTGPASRWRSRTSRRRRRHGVAVAEAYGHGIGPGRAQARGKDVCGQVTSENRGATLLDEPSMDRRGLGPQGTHAVPVGGQARRGRSMWRAGRVTGRRAQLAHARRGHPQRRGVLALAAARTNRFQQRQLGPGRRRRTQRNGIRRARFLPGDVQRRDAAAPVGKPQAKPRASSCRRHQRSPNAARAPYRSRRVLYVRRAQVARLLVNGGSSAICRPERRGSWPISLPVKGRWQGHQQPWRAGRRW